MKDYAVIRSGECFERSGFCASECVCVYLFVGLFIRKLLMRLDIYCLVLC